MVVPNLFRPNRNPAQVQAELRALNRKIHTEGTQSVLRTALACGVTKVVFSSNAEVIFNGQDISGGNEMMPYPSKPWSQFTACVEITERMVLRINGTNGLKTAAIRTAGIYGYLFSFEILVFGI